MTRAVVLFAHGSRDPEWSRPIERLACALAARCARPVRTAFLEHTGPSLDEALGALAAAGVQRIEIVPVFLGTGGHLKEDLPRMIAAARAARPGVAIELEEPIGEQAEVLDAIALALAARLA